MRSPSTKEADSPIVSPVLLQAQSRTRKRILPLAALLYAMAYIDRVNVGFVAVPMSADLKFNGATFGLGAGMFFLGYVLFEVPSNVMLQRVGARSWIARIMITWGLVSCAMMFVNDAHTFYALRFALGAAEAGFFPGMILYLGKWFTSSERARSIAMFMIATSIAGIVSAPLAGLILAIAPSGLRSWQWLFLFEGFPSIALGIYVWWRLDEFPAQADWLSVPEREALTAALDAERLNIPTDLLSVRSVIAMPGVLILSLAYLGLVATVYGIGFWFSTMATKAFNTTASLGTTISTIPYVAAAIAMVLIATRADVHQRWRHASVGCTLAASTALFISAAWDDPIVLVVAISAASAGIWAALPPFWALTTRTVARLAPARGIAIVNSVGNVGGFIAPLAVGTLYDRTHLFAPALVTLAIAAAIAALLLWLSTAALEPIDNNG